MAGAKLKLNSELTKGICNDLLKGIPIKYAAKKNGISHTTFYVWYNKGKEADNGLFREFYDEIEKAKAVAIEQYLKKIKKASETSWQAAAWWLERTCPDDFALKKEVKADVKVEDKHMGLARIFTEEELRKMKEDLENTDDIDEALDDDFSEFE